MTATYVFSERRKERYLRLVEFVMAHHGRFPSVREIMAICGISSSSYVTYELGILIREGLVGLDQDGLTNHYYLEGMLVSKPNAYENLMVELGIGDKLR